jgi:hypothetical protein
MVLPFLRKPFIPLLPSFRRKSLDRLGTLRVSKGLPNGPESSAFTFRRISICIGAIVLLSLLSCALPKPMPLLDGPRLKSFEQAAPLTVYNRTNLFDYMNGEAETYLPFGFHLLYVSIYRTQKTDSRMVLEVYDMSTPEGAGAILKKYSAEGGSRPAAIGDAAWADKGIVLFTRKNYFVRLFPDPSPENEVRPTSQEMLGLAKEIAAVI